MKKLIYYLAVMLIATACEKGDEKQEDQLILSDRTEQNQTAHADQMEAGEMTFIAKSSWTATVKGETQTSDVDWLHLMLGGKETYKGTAGTFTLSFKLTPNDTGVERTATITIKSGDNSIAVTVLQTQTTEDGEVLIAKGETGALSWKLTNNGVLTISGKGKMPDYERNDYFISEIHPWHLFREAIKSVIIENGVTSIGNNAFKNCSLTTVTIPNSVTAIGMWAFDACTSLTSIVIPKGVAGIEANAFSSCISLTEVFIPNSVIEIGAYAFENCTSLTSVTIPGSVKTIGGAAFNWCVNLADVIISHGVETIEGHAFSFCPSLTEINIPNSVTIIGSYAFYECKNLVSVTIPNSLIEIARYTFYDCCSLKKITIPYSVIEIGDCAFLDCTGLTEITLETTYPPLVGHSNFNNINPSIYVCEQSLQAYRNDPFWSTFNLQVRN